MNPWSFFATLAGVRLLRFGIEAALAAQFGRGILAWMKSPTFQWIVGGFIALAVIGTVISAIAVFRSTKGGRGIAADMSPRISEPVGERIEYRRLCLRSCILPSGWTSYRNRSARHFRAGGATPRPASW